MSALFRDVFEPSRRAGAAGLDLVTGLVADFAVFATLEAAEPLWRDLEMHAPHSAYQRFDFCAAWQDRLGTPAGITPLIITGVDRASGHRFLLPLGVKRSGPLRLAAFLGGKHANYKLGLMEGGVSGAALAAALVEAGRRARLDAVVLFDQPGEWAGRTNPLATALPSWPAPTRTWRASLEGGFDDFFGRMRGTAARRRLKWRRRKLSEAAPLCLERARDAEEALRLVEVFLRQKRERFAERGVRNAFADDCAVAFLRSLAAGVGGRRAVIDIFALRAGETVVATLGGGAACGHFSGYFISIGTGELNRFGPGEVILADVIRTLCDEGIRSLDLGIGDSAYKALWCEPEILRDAVLPITAAGRALPPLLRAARRAKGRLKRDPRTEAQIAAILSRRGEGDPEPATPSA